MPRRCVISIFSILYEKLHVQYERFSHGEKIASPAGNVVADVPFLAEVMKTTTIRLQLPIPKTATRKEQMLFKAP
jgi:hypothetical protein